MGDQYPYLVMQLCEKGINNKELAEKAGISYPTLRRMLRGKQRLQLEAAVKIRHAMGMDDMDLGVLFRKRQE